MESANKFAKSLENKYGIENLYLTSDREIGRIEGQIMMLNYFIGPINQVVDDNSLKKWCMRSNH